MLPVPFSWHGLESFVSSEEGVTANRDNHLHPMLSFTVLIFTFCIQLECWKSTISSIHMSGRFFLSIFATGIKMYSPQIKTIWSAKLVWAQLDHSFSCSCAYLWYNEECQKFPKDLQSYSDPAGSSSKNLSFLLLLRALNNTDVSIKCLWLCYW